MSNRNFQNLALLAAILSFLLLPPFLLYFKVKQVVSLSRAHTLSLSLEDDVVIWVDKKFSCGLG